MWNPFKTSEITKEKRAAAMTSLRVAEQPKVRPSFSVPGDVRAGTAIEWMGNFEAGRNRLERTEVEPRRGSGRDE
jgi:hypothetical protein